MSCGPSVTRIHSAARGIDGAMIGNIEGRETGVTTLSCSDRPICSQA
jgi:hypothetical protein